MLVNMLTTAISVGALLLSAVTFGLAYRASKGLFDLDRARRHAVSA
jgi:hypothetical protein